MGKKSKSKNNQPQTQQKKPQSEPNTQEKVVLTDLNAIMKQLQDNQQKGGKKKSKKMNSMVVDQAQRSSKDNKSERASAFAWQSIGHHDNSGDLWVVIKEGVYNLTKMVDNHPGGKKVITVRGGRDATKAFASGNHPESVIQKKLPKYLMGALNKDSTRQQWQSEQKQGRKDCLLALFLSCSIISFMIYLV